MGLFQVIFAYLQQNQQIDEAMQALPLTACPHHPPRTPRPPPCLASPHPSVNVAAIAEEASM